MVWINALTIAFCVVYSCKQLTFNKLSKSHLWLFFFFIFWKYDHGNKDAFTTPGQYGTVGGKIFNQKKKDKDCGFKYFVKWTKAMCWGGWIEEKRGRFGSKGLSRQSGHLTVCPKRNTCHASFKASVSRLQPLPISLHSLFPLASVSPLSPIQHDNYEL